MNAIEVLMKHAELVAVLTNACTAALKGGMSKDDVVATLARIQELLESAED